MSTSEEAQQILKALGTELINQTIIIGCYQYLDPKKVQYEVQQKYDWIDFLTFTYVTPKQAFRYPMIPPGDQEAIGWFVVQTSFPCW